MSYLCSVGTSLPEYSISQTEIKQLVYDIFPKSQREKQRLLPVFEHANIEERQFVVPKSWFLSQHSFQERNELYKEHAIIHSMNAIDQCLANSDFLSETIPYQAVDAIIFVSSTGLSTPSIDAHIINNREFRDDVVRIPIWGLGCAAGVSGMARAHEFLTANPTATVLVISVELCSLTFQKEDSKKSNFIGTALFGDGIAAALLVGDQSDYLRYRNRPNPRIVKTSSRLKKDSLDVMGWDISDTGFEVVFARSIPQLIETFWRDHVYHFLKEINLTTDDINFYVAHPGGAKVLQSMEAVVNRSRDSFRYSYQILKEHGNMSSATIFYVLKEWMYENIRQGEKTIMTALGPGFSSELISMEWV